VAVLDQGGAAELARETGQLLSGSDGSDDSGGSLYRLAFLAARQVPACSGAAAAVWRDGDAVAATATHPDLSELFEVSWRTRSDPWQAALRGGEVAYCPDTLAEQRWPAYAEEARCRGVRCSVTLARSAGIGAITLSLFGTRPGTLDPGQPGLVGLLSAFGGAIRVDDPLTGHDDHRRAPARDGLTGPAVRERS
jgi:hypothetical protein